MFEEMLQATEKGLDHLPPRVNRGPGQIQNPAKLQREAEEKYYRDDEQRKDQERKERQKELKAKLAETNYGGRGAPVGVYNKQRTHADAQAAKQA